MNKRTFTLELTSENDSLKDIDSRKIGFMFYRGMIEVLGSERASKIWAKYVEQNCGTPIDSSKKLFDLLREASDILEESDYAKDRNVAYKIQDYLVSIGEEI